MGAREKLEQHSIFLQKMAYRILTDDTMRLATISSMVGDTGYFDRDMSAILTILFAHNNLAPSVPERQKPKTLLEEIAEDLQKRGFALPSFNRRWKHIESVTNGSFRRNEAAPFGGGEAGSLDRPLRRLREKMYEIRLNDAGHSETARGEALTSRTGEETTALVEQLISSVKALKTDGMGYNVQDNGERATKRKTEFLNSRFDQFAAKLNQSVGSTAEGEKIALIHLHPTAWENSDRGDRWYAVAEDDFARLIPTIDKAIEGDFNPPNTYEFVSDLIGPEPDEDDMSDRAEVWRQEAKALNDIARERTPGGDPSVRTVQLPFAPDQIDDNFPTIELHKDSYIGPNLSSTIIENVNLMRFAGFVDFDQDYRMMILWANAPDDSQKDALGNTYRDMLERFLKHEKRKFAEILGMEPEVHRTKSGAALYFPKPTSLPRLVKSFGALQNLISTINSQILEAENNKGLSRIFNKDVHDNELPAYMENAS